MGDGAEEVTPVTFLVFARRQPPVNLSPSQPGVTMPCCSGQCAGIESQFDARTARHDLRRYRRRGPRGTTRVLLAALRQAGVRGATLLDVGGGVGVIHHELLADGAARATHVDASSSYLAAARDEAERRGHADRVELRYGNFVELAPAIGDADVVTLDRVICCFDDMQALVAASAAHARRLYGLVYPTDNLLVRLGGPIVNALLRLKRSGFRTFIHRTADVDRVVRAAGLTKIFAKRGVAWQVVVYARGAASPVSPVREWASAPVT